MSTTLLDILKKGLPKKKTIDSGLVTEQNLSALSHAMQLSIAESNGYNQAIDDMEANLPDLVAEIEKIIKQEVIKEHNLLNRDC